ncbi:unnamed protein product, partial [marine sediment metagenome]
MGALNFTIETEVAFRLPPGYASLRVTCALAVKQTYIA